MRALSHQEADRVPIDLGGTIATSIARWTYVPLREHLGLPPETVRVLDITQQLPYISEDVLTRFQVDTRMVTLSADLATEAAVFDDGDYWAFHDRWGAKLRMPKSGGLYYDWVEHPIREATMEALDRYPWPQPDRPELFAALGAQAKRLHEETDHLLSATCDAGLDGGIFEQSCRICGMENFMMGLATDERWAVRVMDRITELSIASIERFLGAVGPYLGVFWYGDDVSTQEGWMIDPGTYERLIKPRQRRLVETVKRLSDAKFMYHCCGAASGLYPHLIDIGVDIVNPVQVSAAGMDTRRLKAEFGRDLVFWGGGVDSQRILPFGTPGQVRDEVHRRIDDLAPGGGFVFAPVHNIQAGVPPENVVAAFEAALEYGGY